jgi:hypothetical protein
MSDAQMPTLATGMIHCSAWARRDEYEARRAPGEAGVAGEDGDAREMGERGEEEGWGVLSWLGQGRGPHDMRVFASISSEAEADVGLDGSASSDGTIASNPDASASHMRADSSRVASVLAAALGLAAMPWVVPGISPVPPLASDVHCTTMGWI